MKTTIKVQKTANKSFRQVIVKVVTAVLGLVLISFTVNSQDILNQLSPTNKVNQHVDSMYDQGDENAALLAILNSAFATYPTVNAPTHSPFRIELATEKSQEIESWMIDSNYFNHFISFANDMDEPLELEEWMTNDLNFNSTPIICVVEMEKEMPVESWMTDEYFWVN